jgi:hypothetical protein
VLAARTPTLIVLAARSSTLIVLAARSSTLIVLAARSSTLIVLAAGQSRCMVNTKCCKYSNCFLLMNIRNMYRIHFSPLWRCGPTQTIASSFLRFLDHTKRRITVGRTPLDEWSALRRDLYLTTHNTQNRQTSMPRWDSNPRFQQASGRRPTP